jgi:hypothetical protein
MTDSDYGHDLGVVKGKLCGIADTLGRMQKQQDRIEERLRKQEIKNTSISVVAGAIAAMGVNLLSGGGSGGGT